METNTIFVIGITAFIVGAAISAICLSLVCRQRMKKLADELKSESERRITAETKAAEIPKLESSIKEKDSEIFTLREERASLKTQIEEQIKLHEEKLSLLNDAKNKLEDTFKALSAEALKSNNTQFLELARISMEKFQTDAKAELEARHKAVDHLVQPIQNSLANMDTTLKELERMRSIAYSAIETQLKTISGTEKELKEETAKLVAALSKPSTGGLWGQVQLRNVVELAGMTKNCEFIEQQAVTTTDGRIQPDMVIKLPHNRKVVVDSKLSFDSYYQATKAENDNTRKAKLKEYVINIRTHISNLSTKGYWEQFQPGLECVILFLPGEVFFSTAIQEDPNLIQFGIEKRVLLVSPTTLIAVLLGIAYDWRQEQIAENAQIISELGKELYDRIRTLSAHFEDMQKGLNNAVEAYNKAVGSFQNRILVTARRFRELGAASGDEIKPVPGIDTTTRKLQIEDNKQSTPGETRG